MNANDTQALLVNTLSKIAERKKMEEKKEVKKDKEDKPMKGMSDCSYAEKMAETLDYLSANFDLAFGSPLQKAVKLAGSNEVPNILPNSQSSGPAGKKINETRDSMATGEEPSENKGGAKSTFEGIPNVVMNTADKRPGGASENPSDPPLYNKTAFSKVLSKLAGNKTAGDLEIPNTLKIMKDTDSGKGQSGYDSGSSHGNGNRSLVDSTNERAMDYTKADAKKQYNKEQMSQVMDEVHPDKDKALDRAFSHGVETAKLAGVTGNMGLGGLAAGGLREGASALGNAVKSAPGKIMNAGKAVGGAIGDAANYVKENPKNVALAGAGLAGLTGASYGAGRAGEALADSAMGEDPSTGRLLGGLAGAAPSIGLLAKGHPLLSMAALPAGVYGGAALGNAVQNKLSPQEKQASSCTCEGKGTCDHCKKTMKKAASILRKLAEDMPTNMPAGATPDASNQMTPPPEMAGQMGGQEDQIEKLKKLLMLMQMAKKQEQTQMMQGQGASPDMASPGAGAASEMATASAGPSQGMM